MTTPIPDAPAQPPELIRALAGVTTDLVQNLTGVLLPEQVTPLTNRAAAIEREAKVLDAVQGRSRPTDKYRDAIAFKVTISPVGAEWPVGITLCPWHADQYFLQYPAARIERDLFAELLPERERGCYECGRSYHIGRMMAGYDLPTVQELAQVVYGLAITVHDLTDLARTAAQGETPSLAYADRLAMATRRHVREARHVAEVNAIPVAPTAPSDIKAAPLNAGTPTSAPASSEETAAPAELIAVFRRMVGQLRESDPMLGEHLGGLLDLLVQMMDNRVMEETAREHDREANATGLGSISDPRD